MKEEKPKGIEELVIETIRTRREAGLKKYGVGVEREDIDLVGWLQHLQEELLDAAIYIERLKADKEIPIAPVKKKRTRIPRETSPFAVKLVTLYNKKRGNGNRGFSSAVDIISKLNRLDNFSNKEIEEVITWFMEQDSTYFWYRIITQLSCLRKVCKDGNTRFEHLRKDRKNRPRVLSEMGNKFLNLLISKHAFDDSAKNRELCVQLCDVVDGTRYGFYDIQLILGDKLAGRSEEPQYKRFGLVSMVAKRLLNERA